MSQAEERAKETIMVGNVFAQSSAKMTQRQSSTYK